MTDKLIFDTHGADSTLAQAYDGLECTIVRAVTEREADLEDVGPMFWVRFASGDELCAFADELTGFDVMLFHDMIGPRWTKEDFLEDFEEHADGLTLREYIGKIVWSIFHNDDFWWTDEEDRMRIMHKYPYVCTGIYVDQLEWYITDDDTMHGTVI